VTGDAGDLTLPLERVPTMALPCRTFLRTSGRCLTAVLLLALVLPAVAAQARTSEAIVGVTTGARVVTLDLTASRERLALRPGILTEAFTFNGRVPGPTLEFREGDSVVVRFRSQARGEARLAASA
jgi:FtsP/CotA-like multicopper oxidase with cupredoxin domain